MPQATRTEYKSSRAAHSSSSSPKQQGSKQLRGMYKLYDESKSLYTKSSLASSVETVLRVKSRPLVTKAVSLGLGSLSEKSRDQPRRFKQLAIFLSIAEHLRQASPSVEKGFNVELYAQDPSFTKADESFLESLGIQVLKTPSPSDLGEARHVIDQNTLVYSPFLTISAYRLVLELCSVDLLIGDDFNSLLLKWDKHTAEHKEVVQLAKLRISQYQRRAVSGNGFWDEDDRAFPMALYGRKADRRQNGTPSAANHRDPAIYGSASELAKARL